MKTVFLRIFIIIILLVVLILTLTVFNLPAKPIFGHQLVNFLIFIVAALVGIGLVSYILALAIMTKRLVYWIIGIVLAMLCVFYLFILFILNNYGS